MGKCLIIVALACLVVGCANNNRQGLIAAGYPPDYVDGYLDGYSSGCNSIGHPFYRFLRDEERYRADSKYQAGWQDGFSIARTDYTGLR